MTDDSTETRAARILIVEDKAILAEDLGLSLKNLGYVVRGKVFTGEEAVKLAEKLRPDLILMDIKLQGDVDGIQAADQIRTRLDIPVVYLTAYGEKDVLERAKKTEPYGYLSKPISLTELRNTIETALYKHNADKRVRESEEKYRAIAENANIGIFTTSFDGTFLQANSAAARMAGYDSLEEFLAIRAEDLYSDESDRLRFVNELQKKGSVKGYEILAQKKDGTPQWVSLSAVIQKDHGGNPVSILGIAEDITEHKRATDELARASERVSRILGSITDGFLALDQEMHVTYFNKAAEQLLGRNSEDVIGKRLFDAFPEAKLSIFEEKYTEALRDRTQLSFETFFGIEPYKNWYEVRVYPFEDGISVYFQVTTERKEVEEKIRRSEERFRSLIDQAADAIFVHDFNGRFLDVNQQASTSLGYAREELLSMSVSDVDPDVMSRGDIANFWASLPATFEATNIRKDGTAFPVEMRLGPIEYGGTKVVLAIARDISDRKVAEKERRETENKYRSLVEASPDPIIMYDLKGNLITVNQQAASAYGVDSPEQLLAEVKNVSQILDEESQEKAAENLKRILAKGSSRKNEYTIIRKDGSTFPVEINSSTIRSADGVPISFISVVRDITDRKEAEEVLTKARYEMEQRVAERTAELSILNERLAQDITERKNVEEALRKSEERVELALKGADLGLWDYNIQTGEAFINERRAEMVGYRLAESEPRITWWGSQVHPEDLERVRQAFNAHVKGRAPLYESEHRLLHKSGEYIWILARGKIVEWDESGYPVRIVGTSLDITDRKRTEQALHSARNELERRVEQRTAELRDTNEQLLEQIDERKQVEEALRKSEERYRINFENVKDVIISLNAELDVIDVTPSIEKTLGYLPGDLVGRAFTDLKLLEPSSLLAALEDARRVLCGETLENRVYSFIHKNGTARFGEVSGAPLVKDGTIIGLVAVGRDITERKRAEESLLDAELRYEGLIETTQTGFVELDASGRVTEANDVYSRMAGASRSEDIIGRSVLDWTAPECLLENEAAVRLCSIQGHISDFETTYLRADGSRARILINATTEDGPEGLRIATLCRDITERKMMEEALREANLVVENSPVVLFRWRAAEGWPVTMVSKNVKQFGYDQEELLAGAVPFASMVHPEDLDRLNREMQAYSASWNDRFQQEYRIVTKDGEVRWVDDRTLVERNDEGEILFYQGIVIDITQRKDAEKSLREKETLLERILDASPVGINYVRNRYMVWSNRAWEKMFRFKHPDEYVGKSARILYQSDEEYERTGEAYYSAIKDDATTETDVTLLRTDGSVFDANVRVRLVEKTNLDVLEAVVAVSDISNRKLAEAEREKLQQQLLQAQKMESVGRLAGGVAHDFNNMLSAILGHVELAMMGSNSSEPICTRLNVIKESALRSADLVRQLLAFARKQTVAPKVLDVNETVAGLLKMLLRLMGEDIDIVWMPGACLWTVKIDPSQIDQILANLCVNARDAITGVGKVTIETENTSFDDAYCAVHPGSMCGDYVMLAVSDDGCGMSKEVLDHIFEPFFTTKELGTGTGLGLATVYGIVKQNEGFISVYSEPGQGTTFKIYLPRFVGEAIGQPRESAPETPRGRGELVLLVEDETVILNVGREMLEQLGYNVLTAETPTDALRQARAHAAEIQLLITDVVMPEMNGRDLAKSINDIKPGLKCLFTSGYTSNAIAHHGVLEEDVHFIQKPFSLHDLATKVRETLERG